MSLYGQLQSIDIHAKVVPWGKNKEGKGYLNKDLDNYPSDPVDIATFRKNLYPLSILFNKSTKGIFTIGNVVITPWIWVKTMYHPSRKLIEYWMASLFIPIHGYRSSQTVYGKEN